MDTERLLGATNANIVQELKRLPERLGILSAVLDGKLLHLPSIMALAIAREFADVRLSAAMASRGLALTGKQDAVERLADSDLAHAFSGTPKGTRTRGPKPGSNTEQAFRKLADIEASKDVLLNAAVGAALKSAGLIIERAHDI